MDQVKIGRFMAALRKENNMTQEQLADKLNVARRTVSRWETGSNMPDMDILIELSDLYAVDLRELLDGERKDSKMDPVMKETVLKVAEYESEGKRRTSRVVQVFCSLGIIALTANLILQIIDMPDSFLTGCLKGITFAVALGAMLISIVYVTGQMTKLHEFKMRLKDKK